MEIEVKIRLPDAGAYGKVCDLLAAEGTQKAVHAQKNLFFDGVNGELSEKRVVLRVRDYDAGKRAVLTLKGKAIVEGGISRASEQEEDINPEVASAYEADPDKILELSSPLMDALKEKFELSKLVCLGGFANTRKVYEWEGQTLEVDETDFDHGTVYEIECEAPEEAVEGVKARIEAFLEGAGIAYEYSSTTKFANFKNKTLL